MGIIGGFHVHETSFVGPVIGGEVVSAIGFPWLMRLVGLINILYSPFLILLDRPSDQVSELKI